MNTEIKNFDMLSKTKSSREGFREGVTEFENNIALQEEAFFGDNECCPLKHSFSDGIYVREISIPAGMYIVGKLHKHSHPNFLLSGTVDVVTEFGKETLTGPLSIISKAGTKRALHAITPLVWITVHANPTNTQDLEELEKIVIADSYEEYDKFIASKGPNKAITFIKKLFKIGGVKCHG